MLNMVDTVSLLFLFEKNQMQKKPFTNAPQTGVLENFKNIIKKRLCRRLFFKKKMQTKSLQLYKKWTGIGVFL